MLCGKWRAAVILLLALAGCGQKSEAQVVYEACQEVLLEQLVAPTTAVFPPIEEVQVLDFPGRYNLRGEFDSQNRMGVPLRMTYICIAPEGLTDVRVTIVEQ